MLRAFALSALLSAGCAQLFGLDETSRSQSTDAPKPIDASIIDAPPIDAQLCAGGDARVTDPTSGHCYVLFLTPATRDAARATCATLGANTRLASLQSAEENQLVSTLVGQRDVFLGANDEITEGTFIWDDGTAVVLTNWNTGEPNNGLGMFEEDCMVMRNSDTMGTWDDRPCAPPPDGLGIYPFVCER